MRIAIDARVLERGMTGVGRYLQNFLDTIPQVDSRNKYFLIGGKFEENDFYKKIKTKNPFLPDKIFSALYPHFILPFQLKKQKIDVYYNPNISLPFFKIGRVKYISTVHDIMFLLNKSFFSFIYRNYMRMLLPLVIRKADKILTVSEYSRMDFLRHYDITEDKVEVVYSYAQSKFAQRYLEASTRQHLRGKYNLPEKFILFVGAIENRKNIKCILDVADKLMEIEPDIKVVLAGKRRHCDFDPIAEFEKRKGSVFYLNSVNDEDLPFIYNMAFCFLFPTYYEGFGYPPLEAMQSGLPVITSNNSSLPEVVGSAGILVEPDDLNAIILAIIKLNSDPSFFKTISEKGIVQARKFNGLDSTKKLIKIITSLSAV